MENETTPTDSEIHKGGGAFDAFLNLLSLITLGWLAHAFGAVCFQLINKNFGDLNSYIASPQYYSGLLKYGISSLVIITPIYFLAINVLHNKYKKKELNHDSGIYKWLTYLMLLVSSLVIIGSLITLITSFLDGNYTSSFVLKVLTVIIVAGMIFGYYFYDLKRKNYDKKDLVSIVLGSVVVISILSAIIVGFFNIESPIQSRNRREDNKTKEALSQTYYYINNSYNSSKDLKEEYDLNFIFPSSDRVSYRKISEQEYELCAEFKTSDSGISYGDRSIPWFNHEAGWQCYIIDPNFEYQKNNKIIEREVPIEPIGAPASAVKQ